MEDEKWYGTMVDTVCSVEVDIVGIFFSLTSMHVQFGAKHDDIILRFWALVIYTTDIWWFP